MARPKNTTPNYKLHKRGSRWYVRWWENGTWRRVSCGTEDRGAAQSFLAEFIIGQDTPEPPASPTVRDVMAGYADAKGEKAADYPSVARRNHIIRHMGDLRVSAINDAAIRRYMSARTAEGYTRGSMKASNLPRRELQPATLRAELIGLTAALNWARRQRWIDTVPHIPLPPPGKPRERWLTRDEARRLLDACATDHIRLFVLLGLFTGARSAALCALRWDQVDLTAGTIRLGGEAGQKRRAKLLPIAPPLMAALREAYERRTCDYVVEYAGRPIQRPATSFAHAAEKAGLKGVTPHILRHTAATWMVQAGRPVAEVAAFLGNTVQMIERVYGHHSPEWLRGASGALAATWELPGPVGTGNDKQAQAALF